MSVFGFDVRYFVGGQVDPGLQRVSLAFERAGTDFSNFGQYIFPKLGTVLEREVGKQFDAEGRGPNAGRWAGLSARYAESKRRRYGFKPILEATGRLKGALTSPGPNARRQYSSREFVFGTQGVRYASFHQTGTGRMPARPPLDLTQDFEREIRAVSLSTARDIVKQANLPELKGD